MSEAPEPSPDEAEARRGLPLKQIAVGVLAIGGLVLLGRFLGDRIEPFQQWVEGLGAWGPIAFIAGYAIAVVAFAPASVLTLAAGGIFGLFEGAAYVFVAAVLGSTVAFLVARYAARAAVEKRIEGDLRFALIDRAIGEQGRKIAFLLRLSPAVPFNVLNYGLGLTRIRLVDYLIASIGMIPGTFLYVYLGFLATETVAAAGGAGGAEAGTWVVRILGVVATIGVTVYVTIIARRALDEATGEGEEA